jgi:hypothetical protein
MGPGPGTLPRTLGKPLFTRVLFGRPVLESLSQKILSFDMTKASSHKATSMGKKKVVQSKKKATVRATTTKAAGQRKANNGREVSVEDCEDDDMSSHVGDILDTDTDAVMEAVVEDVRQKPCRQRCEDAMMDSGPIEISGDEEETADEELHKVSTCICKSVN